MPHRDYVRGGNSPYRRARQRADQEESMARDAKPYAGGQSGVGDRPDLSAAQAGSTGSREVPESAPEGETAPGKKAGGTSAVGGPVKPTDIAPSGPTGEQIKEQAEEERAGRGGTAAAETREERK